MTENSEQWRVWDSSTSYGEVLSKRASGMAPEMESSKAAARQLKGVLEPGNSLLDVGCGPGHYLRSLWNQGLTGFEYTGIDATEQYIDLGRKVFQDNPHVRFMQGDVVELPCEDSEYDVAMCNNVLLHMPSIARPLSELCRVTRSFVLVRTLCGERSFRIQDVHPQSGLEFDANGNPHGFHYYNIYSRSYVSRLLDAEPRVARYEIVDDRDFDPGAIEKAVGEHKNAFGASRTLHGWQLNGYILQPWVFIRIWLK